MRLSMIINKVSIFVLVFSFSTAHAVLTDVVRNGGFETGDIAYWSEPSVNLVLLAKIENHHCIGLV